jgi:hypothetical protein
VERGERYFELSFYKEQLVKLVYQKVESLRSIINSIPNAYLLLSVILFFSFLIFGKVGLLITLLLGLDISISKFIARAGPPGLGLELASLATVITGMIYGPIAGSLIGFSSIILRSLSGIAGIFMLWKIPGFAALGFLSGLILESIFPGGLLLIFSMRILFIFIEKIVTPSAVFYTILFTITNLAFLSVIARQISYFGFIA